MPVSKKHYEQGTIPTAAELNQPYTDLATESASVDEENTASGWATVAHFDTSAQQCNRLYKYVNETTGTVTISGTSYATVSIGGLAAEIDLTGFEPDQYEATRFCASGLIRQTSITNDNDDDNYYAFRLLLTYNDGAGDVTETIGEWGYSLTNRALTTELTGVTGDQIQYQTFQFSAVRRYDGATGTREYKKIELQCKVNLGTNSVNVSRHQIFVISGRR